MSVVHDARSILAALQPLTGARATGNVTVKAVPGPTAILKGGSYGVPVIQGAARYDRLVKVAQNPADKAGWTVAAGGTVVPCFTNVGGVDQVIPPGTLIRWFPAIDGTELASSTPAGLAGAAPNTSTVGIAQLAFYEELQPGAGMTLFRGAISRFPAVVLSWDGSGDAEPVGRGQWAQEQQWSLFVVASRQDADPARRMQGLLILDAIQEQLWGRGNVDGEGFSSPRGVDFSRRQSLPIDEKFFLYRARFSTMATYRQSETRTFSPWQKTKLDLETTDTPTFPTVVDNEFPMPQ
jgi:hypothetical protein